MTKPTFDEIEDLYDFLSNLDANIARDAHEQANTPARSIEDEAREAAAIEALLADLPTSFDDVEPAPLEVSAKVSANSDLPNPAQPHDTPAVAPSGPRPTLVAVGSLYFPSNLPSPSRPSTPSHLTRPSTPTRLHVPANRNLIDWSRAPERQKIQSIGQAAETSGAIAFTCQTSARKEASLRRSAAAGRDIRQTIADEIARQFRKRGLPVPPILFGIEIAPAASRRLHIHGAFLPADDSPAYLDAVRDAFCHALGKIKGQAGSTQYKAEPLYDAAGWIAYFTKHAWRVRRDLGIADPLYVSRSMRQIGRTYHEALRKPAATSAATTTTTKTAPASTSAAPASPAPTVTSQSPRQRPQRLTSARRVFSAVLHRPGAQSSSVALCDEYRVIPARPMLPPRGTSPPFLK